MKTKKILLITSGAYSNDEIASDFGLLPPSFLPIGHKRLIQLQVELIKNLDVNKFLTIPNNYNLSTKDKLFLSSNNINVYRVDPNISLCKSILNFCISNNVYDVPSFYILHGDTLFDKISLKDNIIYFAKTDMFYKWGQLDDLNIENVINRNEIYQYVLSGFFSFKNTAFFIDQLKKSESFEVSLVNYSKKYPFTAIEEQGWLDFGHSNLYYISKRSLNVTRSFNSAVVKNNHIKKSSNNIFKICNEYEWFKQIPESLSSYVPSVWDLKNEKKTASYMIEFIGAPTLQEKFVFGNLPELSLYKIIDNIFDFISQAKKNYFDEYSSSETRYMLEDLYLKKTRKRVEKFIFKSKFKRNLDVQINNKKYVCFDLFVEEVLGVLSNDIKNLSKDFKFSIMHGDLCFSNILFDSRSNSLKLIDPRGSLNDKSNIKNKLIGDFRYDVAKLGHSMIANYDFIVTGFSNITYDLEKNIFEFNIEKSDFANIDKYFYKKSSDIGVSKSFLKASVTNLFLSMLPLHDDDKSRQLSLLINSYKFYYD